MLADQSTYDAHLSGSLPAKETWYLVFRDYDSHRGWFTVERPHVECTGTGQVATIPDDCMDDRGTTGVADSLEIYCFNNKARFCLSGEACPWRTSWPTIDHGKTCTRGGLAGSPESADYGEGFMTHAWCSHWAGHEWYYCNSASHIEFR